VLTLWAAVVAERLGTAVVGLNARSKARRLGIIEDATDQSQPREPMPTATGARHRR
jgi:hypothetical protein